MRSNTFIYIRNLRVHAYHGVMPQERVVGNDYVVNLKVGYPWQKAMDSDNLADTLSYADLVRLVERVMDVPSALLEHVAGRMVNEIKEMFPLVGYVKLDIAKIAPPMSADCQSAGIEIIIEE